MSNPLRGFIASASLKRGLEELVLSAGVALRGFIASASLKRSNTRSLGLLRASSPRLHRLGLIEALRFSIA